MAWTDGVDKATNDVVTAAIWNQYLGATGNIMLVPQLAANVATPTSTTSTSVVDLVTVSGLSIPLAAGVRILFNFRKQALAAQGVYFGLKINSTVVLENAAVLRCSTTNRAEDGFGIIDILPRSSANYLNGINVIGGARVSSTGATASTPAIENGMTAPIPNAVITSIAIRAMNDTTSNAAEVTSVQIWQLGR